MASVEVMTACENVCRDFGWILSADPRIVQGVLTLGAALVTAGVALHIAKHVYPVQKNKDRDIKIDEEKRIVFRDFLKSVDVIVNQRLFQKTQLKIEAHGNCKSALNEVLIFADRETAKKMLKLYRAVSELSAALSEQPQDRDVDFKTVETELRLANDALRVAINSAREELGLQKLDVPIAFSILSAKPVE